MYVTAVVAQKVQVVKTIYEQLRAKLAQVTILIQPSRSLKTIHFQAMLW